MTAAKIISHEGREVLSIEHGGKAVDLLMPVSVDALDAGLEVLITNLAGVSKAELMIAAVGAMADG